MKKKTYFLCVSSFNMPPIEEEIEAKSMVDAQKKFEELFRVQCTNIRGPYLKKRGWSFKEEQKITFSGVSRRAIYNGWYVRANFLTVPVNTALLYFDDKTDGKKSSPPRREMIVNIGELQLL